MGIDLKLAINALQGITVIEHLVLVTMLFYVTVQYYQQWRSGQGNGVTLALFLAMAMWTVDRVWNLFAFAVWALWNATGNEQERIITLVIRVIQLFVTIIVLHHLHRQLQRSNDKKNDSQRPGREA